MAIDKVIATNKAGFRRTIGATRCVAQTLSTGYWQLSTGPRLAVMTAILTITASCSNNTSNPSPPLSPEDELKTFQFDDNLHIELVASEPMVQDPVVSVFDEDGRLWVVEMRGFMPDIDGKGEVERIGRVAILRDNDGDGKMDESTVYIDSLLLPRGIAIVPGGALIVENSAL